MIYNSPIENVNSFFLFKIKNIYIIKAMSLPKRVMLTFTSQQLVQRTIINLSNSQKLNKSQTFSNNDLLEKLKIIEKK